MARIRSVSPDICVSETMADLTAELERTFVRLWTHCDDEGRASDNVRLLKAAIYPLHDKITGAVLDDQLNDLAQAGLLVRYEVEGKRYLSVVSWDEYQHPQKPRPSKYPAPPVGVSTTSRTPPVTVEDTSSPGGEWERDTGVGEGEGSRVLDVPDEAVRLADLLAARIHDRDPGAVLKPEGWITDIDRLIRLDKRTPAEIERVIYWCQADDFWQVNILSGKKLREKFNTLHGRATARSNGNGARSNNTPESLAAMSDSFVGREP